MDSQLLDFLKILGIIMMVGLVLAMILLAWVFYKVRRINLPAGTDFFDALRATPLAVVVLLDLLDLSLDFFSAPFSWVILGRLGLLPLRAVTAIEALIPGTSLLPTMTIAWFIVNHVDRRGTIQAYFRRFLPKNSPY